MTDPLRVGVIGLGVGEQHLLAFERHSRCTVVAAADHSRDRLDAIARSRPGLETTTDAGELISAGLDVVSIASYDDDHASQAEAALAHGCHVFVEKPLARTSAELAALRDAARAAPGLVVASNLVLRAAPLYGRIRTDVVSGSLGELYAFDGDYLYGRLHKITGGWRNAVEDYSVMLGGGVHLVDLMLWICGERPVRASASGNRISTKGTAFRYRDFVAATFEFESGLVGRVTANFGSVQPHRHVVRVFGTAASVVSDDRGARLFRSADPGAEPERLELAPEPASKGALVDAFVRAVDGERDAVLPLAHELDVIAVCLAADRAVETGGTVDIEYA